MSEENKTVVRRVIEEVWQNGNLDAVDEYFAANYIDHNDLPGVPEGREGIKAFAAVFNSAFSDGNITVEDQVAEEDMVVTRWSATSINSGDFMGVPATGKRVTITGIDCHRIAGGQIMEGWGQADMMGLMQQIGAIPVPEGS